MATKKTAKKAAGRKVARKAASRKPAKQTARARRSARPRPAHAARKEPQGLSLRSASPSFTVNDIEKSLVWYRDVLGLTVGERWEHEGRLAGVELAAGQVRFWLAQDDWKKGRDRVKGEGFRIYCETTQDVDRLAERIKARGGTLEGPRDQPWGGRELAVADPDGFKITITHPA
jgi:uncharacterized glyoxalase superfamily protein PhnB